MLKAPLDVSKARILLSNDDGIHAPGLEVLEKIARTLSDDVWVVAPETEQSGASLVLSGVNHGSNLGEDVTYSGTIAAAMEATLLGVPAIAMSQHLDPAQPALWQTALHWGPEVVRKAVSVGWPRNVLMNVNFPSVEPDQAQGIHIVRHGQRKVGDDLIERTDPRGRSYFWIGTLRGEADTLPDTDIGVVMDKGIAVTPLFLDLTHTPTLDTLRTVFA
jgi:5'-nucleotidase